MKKTGIPTDKLFTPLNFISGCALKNRVLMAPMTTGAGFYDGGVTKDLVEYYRLRAGDPGAVIVECAFIEENGKAFAGAIGIDHDDKIAGLHKVAEAIKQKGSKAIIQIYHGGRMVDPKLIGGERPVGPSSVAAPRPGAARPRELSGTEVDGMIEKYSAAARRAIQAGFDGVEIHGANTYLIQQFYSPNSNHRADKWGGTREKRARFPLAVLQAIHEVAEQYAQKPFIIGYRFSPEELEEPGIRFDDTMFLLEKLAEVGLDYLHFSMGETFRSSIVDKEDPAPLIEKYLARRSERLSRVLIMGVGGIVEEKQAIETIEGGYDLLAIGKGYISEPLWTAKAIDGQKIDLTINGHNQKKLAIPDPLWKTVHFMVRNTDKSETENEQIPSVGKAYLPGIYRETVEDEHGRLVVDIKLGAEQIEKVSIAAKSEAIDTSEDAFSQITSNIVAANSADIDVISGATASSKAVMKAVKKAVQKAAEKPADKVVRDGHYHAVAEGHNGPIELNVGIANGKIEGIAVEKHSETAVIFDQVMTKLSDDIIASQRLDVDVISGATVLSEAVLKATKDALIQSGGDPAEFVSDDEHSAAQTIEKEVDVVVAGSGGAGLTAALKAQKSGLKVLLLEKNGYLGGATILNGSNIVATGSRMSKKIFGEANKDSVERLYKDLDQGSKHTIVKEMTDTLVRHVGEAVDWICENSGLEYVKAQTQTADHSVDRQIELPSSSSSELILTLAETFEQNGGEILMNTRAKELIRTKNEVTGMIAKSSAHIYKIKAASVIFASGGYGAKKELRTEQMKNYLYYGPGTSTGDALEMGEAVNAQTRNIDWYKRYPHGWEVEPGVAKLTTYSSKKATDLGAIYVDRQGRRLMNESSVYSKFRDIIDKQPDKTAFLVMDEPMWQGFYELLLLHGFKAEEIQQYLDNNGKTTPIVVKGPIEEAASAAGIEAHTLKGTIQRYNRFAKNKKDEEFDKSEEYLQEFTGDTFYIVEQKVRFATSLGGLVTNPATMAVLDQDGNEIQSFYAAGEIVGGANGNDSLPSMMNAWIVTSGFIAGEAAAQNALLKRSSVSASGL